MKRLSLLLTLLALPLLTSALDYPVPKPILPDSLKWGSPPNNKLLHGAWVVGSEDKAAPYALRVRIEKGGKIPVHTHPDSRYSTVLSGTLYVGFGAEMDESKMVAVPTGAVYVAPANVPHYLFAKDGEVVYQEGGTGPTKTVFMK